MERNWIETVSPLLKTSYAQKSFKSGALWTFSTLTVAISILSYNGLSLESIDYSRDLLKWHVNTSIKLYGPTFQTFNVHGLIHLPDDVSYLKDNLDNIKAFRFENHLKTLKSIIRNQTVLLHKQLRECQKMKQLVVWSTKKIETKASVKEKNSWFVLKDRKHIFHIVKSSQIMLIYLNVNYLAFLNYMNFSVLLAIPKLLKCSQWGAKGPEILKSSIGFNFTWNFCVCQ